MKEVVGFIDCDNEVLIEAVDEMRCVASPLLGTLDCNTASQQ
jgi:hypothetical protein